MKRINTVNKLSQDIVYVQPELDPAIKGVMQHANMWCLHFLEATKVRYNPSGTHQIRQQTFSNEVKFIQEAVNLLFDNYVHACVHLLMAMFPLAFIDRYLCSCLHSFIDSYVPACVHLLIAMFPIAFIC